MLGLVRICVLPIALSFSTCNVLFITVDWKTYIEYTVQKGRSKELQSVYMVVFMMTHIPRC